MMAANHRDLLFEDNKFSYIEVISHKFTDSKGEPFVPRTITLRGNIWNGKYFNESSYQRNTRPSNTYAGVWDNFALVELVENVFNRSGWHMPLINIFGQVLENN